MTRDLEAFLGKDGPVARVELTRVRGSSPRECGAAMFVSLDASFDTIGGGRLESMAIEAARALLVNGAPRHEMDVPLGPEIGQCCGGRVEIAITPMDAVAREDAVRAANAARAREPQVFIFGAGHVGRALATALALTPVRVVLVDSRPEELALNHAPVETHLTPLPEALVRDAAPGAAFVVLTHDHAQDFLIAAEALARGDAAYVGMIGSRTKRASFDRWRRETGNAGPDATPLTCPIGAAVSGDKRPAVIAALAAAEIVARVMAQSQ